MTSIQVEVIWQNGLNLRAATLIALRARRFHCHTWIRQGASTANAAEVIQTMLIGARTGSRLTIFADGIEEEDAVAALRQLFLSDEDSIEWNEQLESATEQIVAG